MQIVAISLGGLLACMLLVACSCIGRFTKWRAGKQHGGGEGEGGATAEDEDASHCAAEEADDDRTRRAAANEHLDASATAPSPALLVVAAPGAASEPSAVRLDLPSDPPPQLSSPVQPPRSPRAPRQSPLHAPPSLQVPGDFSPTSPPPASRRRLATTLAPAAGTGRRGSRYHQPAHHLPAPRQLDFGTPPALSATKRQLFDHYRNQQEAIAAAFPSPLPDTPRAPAVFSSMAGVEAMWSAASSSPPRAAAWPTSAPLVVPVCAHRGYWAVELPGAHMGAHQGDPGTCLVYL